MTLLRKYFASVLLLLLCIAPVVLWLGYTDLSKITASFGSLVQAGGKASALAGTTLYLLMPVINLRRRFIEYLFNGLDRAHRIHRFSGKLAFFLILGHPILLGIGRLLHKKSLSVIWDWSSLVIILGIISLFGLIAVTVVTIYAHIKHQHWIRIHHYFGWLIPLFLLHGLLARAQVVQIKPLLIYILCITVLGFVSFLYKAVFYQRLTKQYEYEIADVNHLEGEVTELVLKTNGPQISYKPGQYAYVSFISDVIDLEPHPFSFTTANNGPLVRFAIKALGDDTANVSKLKPGVIVKIDGPYGRFSYSISKNPHQVWIAGGVGITPFLAMARSLSKQSEIKVTFYYAFQRLSDAAFLHELFQIRRGLPDSFEVLVVDGRLSGHVTATTIANQIKDFTKPDFFMCGPPAMTRNLKKELIKAGTPQRNIHSEDFSS